MAEATPAPAAAPAAPSAPAPSTPSPAPSTPAAAPSDTSFENLGSYDDLDSVEVSDGSVDAPLEGAAGGEPAQGATTPLPETPPATPPPATAKPAQEPPKEQPKAAPAEASTPGRAEPDNSPQGLVKQLEQHRSAVLDALAAERFKLSPEEISAIDTDAVGAIPHVMARVYYEAMQSTLLHIQNMVPQVVANMIKVQKQNDEVETAFYGQFKALDRAKHHGDVMQFAQMLRGSNPQITQADLFAMVGAAVMAKNNLSAPATNGAAGTPRPAQPAPFVPATPGAHVRVIPEGEAPFAGLGKDFDE